MAVVESSTAVALGEAATLLSEKELSLGTQTSSLKPISINDSRYLVVSPYTEQEHLLDLETLDVENQILAEALVAMKPVREDYSTAPYLESFNWEEVMDRVGKLTVERGHNFKETYWYIVAFRSQVKPTTEYPDLGVLDKEAHAEATASGGFLK